MCHSTAHDDRKPIPDLDPVGREGLPSVTTRTFTSADFEEVRPGLYRLKGHQFYAARAGIKETCQRCEGKGKVPSTSPSGRKSWRQCGTCQGKGQVDALNNAMLDAPRVGYMVCHAADLDKLASDLNRPTCDYLHQPTFVSLYG
jgi:hypothetical protein